MRDWLDCTFNSKPVHVNVNNEYNIKITYFVNNIPCTYNQLHYLELGTETFLEDKIFSLIENIFDNLEDKKTLNSNKYSEILNKYYCTNNYNSCYRGCVKYYIIEYATIIKKN